MDESERILRLKDNRYVEFEDADRRDEEFAERIASILNHPQIDKYCMVDAYYYDFSVIPRDIQEKLQLWRDAYLIFGITKEAEIISKWVDRYDLDSQAPVIDGKVIHPDNPYQCKTFPIPEIKQIFNPKLLSYPAPNLLKFMGGE